MKNKIIIALTLITVLVAGFLFWKQWSNKTNNSEIAQFARTFISDIQNKPADSVITLFDVKQKRKDVIRIIDILAGRTAANGKSKQLFKRFLDEDNIEIKVLSESLAEVNIPLILSYEGLSDFKSSIKFTVLKKGKQLFRITEFNGNDLYTDFVAYENAIRSLTIPDKDIYSPLTLNAFKGALELKSKYDSVVWFSYIDKKPLYYVVNGNWEMIEHFYEDESHDEKEYQMGLVNSDFAEIIPARYDLIHNVGATFDNLIEVEKNGKKGFYDLQGKNVIPVEYDQIIPVTDDDKAAVLANGSDYFWLNKDYTISERDSSIKISDILKKVYVFKNTYNISENNVKNLIEFNSRQVHNAIYIPPSHLADWKIISRVQQFENPLRRNVEFYDISTSVQIKYSKNDETSNWLETAIYSIRDNYIGGRSDFYDKKNFMMIDHRNNKVYSLSIFEDGDLGAPENCTGSETKMLSDTLIQIKNYESDYISIAEKVLSEKPAYHFISLRTGQARELRSKRYFNFTQYTKLDDSYISGCYTLNDKVIHHLPKDFLIYIKMEIYADYNYDFPDKKWNDLFKDVYGNYKPLHSNVDSYLTEVDKYNINWLDKKINSMQAEKLASK